MNEWMNVRAHVFVARSESKRTLNVTRALAVSRS